MTHETTAASDLSAERQPDRPGVGLPGRGFAVVLTVLTVLELYSVSLPGRAAWHLLLLMLWAGMGVVWLAWFVLAVPRPNRLVAVWRFSAIALFVMAVYVIAQSDALLRLRFEMSRPAFEAALADVPFGSGDDQASRIVGLYQIREAYREYGGTLFEVAGTGGGLFIIGGGFLWTENEPDIRYNYEPLGGHWYVWIDYW